MRILFELIFRRGVYRKKSAQRCKYINVHCHFLNFDYIPDAFCKTRTKGIISERVLDNEILLWLVTILLAIFYLPYSLFKFLFYKIFGKLAPSPLGMLRYLLVNKFRIQRVAQLYNHLMGDAGIILATPLMMDIEISSFNQKPECPYRYQIIEIEKIAKGLGWGNFLFPFIMFDPRRGRSKKEEIASNTIINVLERFDAFIGVKMYPKLGYHPDNKSIYNDDATNRELELVYEYCNENKIPITIHCSRDGAYSDELYTKYKKAVDFLGHPSRWEEVIKRYPDINFNFAHFGGGWDFFGIYNKDHEYWSSLILEFMRNNKNVYADVSFHSGAFMRKISNLYFKFSSSYKKLKGMNSNEYFRILKELLNEKKKGEYLYRDKILFGTDWPMTYIYWSEKQYVDTFIKGLEEEGKEYFKQIAYDNPIKFLFPPGSTRLKKFEHLLHYDLSPKMLGFKK